MWVVKRDFEGSELTRYPADEILHQDAQNICLRAVFTRTEIAVGSVTLCMGDQLTEWFFTNRWYNVFLIRNGQDNELKGWYCNFTRPAEMNEDFVAADDLGLDLVITPARRIQILDLEEYLNLPLSVLDRREVATAFREIKQLVHTCHPPFGKHTSNPSES